MSEKIKPGTTTANDIIDDAIKEIEQLDIRNRRLAITLYRIKNALVLMPADDRLKEKIAELIADAEL